MTCLPRPVTKMNCSMPASRASSTAYWTTGLSTTGSISLGIALVAGRNLVPMPATGKTALRTGLTADMRFPGDGSETACFIARPRHYCPVSGIGRTHGPDRTDLVVGGHAYGVCWRGAAG